MSPLLGANSTRGLPGRPLTSRGGFPILKPMFGLGIPELLVLLVIVVLIFGATRLPQIGEGLGKGIKNFRGALREPPEIDVTPPKEPESSSNEPGVGRE